MFLSSNFLFLMSLALISWVLLCYLNEIDESRQLSNQFKHRLRGNATTRSLQEDLLTDMPTLESNYEAFVTFLCIISGFIVFVRFLLSAEKNFYMHLRTTVNEFQKRTGFSFTCNSKYKQFWPTSAAPDAINVCPDTFSIEDYRKLSESQHEQVLKLQRRNSFLESRIRALEQQNLLLMGRGLLRGRKADFRCDDQGNVVITDRHTNATHSLEATMSEIDAAGDHNKEKSPSEQTLCAGIVYSFLSERDSNDDEDLDAEDEADTDNESNNDKNERECGSDFENVQLLPIAAKRRMRGNDVFIANRFFHINHQVYIMEGNLKLHFENFDCGDFTQMWQKYFEMQRLSKKSPLKRPTKPTTTTKPAAPTSGANATPKASMNCTETNEDLSNLFPGLNAKPTTETTKIVTTEQLEAIHGLVN